MKTVINGKRYDVTRVFNMVGNFYFTRKGVDYLVDAGDVSDWVEEEGLSFKDGIQAAIAYAKYITSISEEGVFWWTDKEA